MKEMDFEKHADFSSKQLLEKVELNLFVINIK